MSTENEQFPGADIDSSRKRYEVRRQSKWWLSSLLLPIGSIAFGIAFAIVTPATGYEWFPGLKTFFVTIVIGGILTILSSIISFYRRESLAPLSLLPALPALMLLTWLSYELITYPHKQAERIKAEMDSRKAEDIRQNELSEKSSKWKIEFTEHPELIVSHDFWNKHPPTSDPSLHYGLLWTLNDPKFVVTAEIKTYVLKYLPNHARAVLANGRSTKEELLTYVNSTNYPYEIRKEAVDCLLRDRSYLATDDIKQLVMKTFPDKAGLLFGRNQFTKEELETLLQDPAFKNDAATYLKMGGYKK